ncbi:MAG: acyl carrier protein [Candidatus Eremiobacterota bacterium]
MNIFEELNGIFRTVFDDEDITVNDESTAADVDGWDSLSHVNLIIAIEQKFKIKFSTKELLTFKNVGDLRRAIESKVNA